MSFAARPRWQRIAIIGIVIVAVLAAAAWIATIVLRPHLPTHDEVVKQARADAALSGGARVFALHCAGCHEHAIGPWLGGRGLDADSIRAFVRTGPSTMPSFPKIQVSDADIDAVAAYLGTLRDHPGAKK